MGEAHEDVRYVDDAFYERLLREQQEDGARFNGGPGDTARIEAVRAFLTAEARLLDRLQYRSWAALLASDFVYWVPANPGAPDPRRESARNFDDRRRILDRIALIETGLLSAQAPPSRLVRSVTNVEYWEAGAGAVVARSNLLVHAFRRGRTDRFAGVQEHRLASTPDGFRIRSKRVDLIDAEEPQGNVSFIL